MAVQEQTLRQVPTFSKGAMAIIAPASHRITSQARAGAEKESAPLRRGINCRLKG
jgi:hypothetical protein